MQDSIEAFATVDEVHVGSVLVADGGFSCLKEGDTRTVHEDERGLYVGCQQGSHYLDGQLDEGDQYIGFRLAERS